MEMTLAIQRALAGDWFFEYASYTAFVSMMEAMP
jgi:hypothetical protein